MSALHSSAHALHNYTGGINEARLDKGPRAYAGELVRYIRDPSKIRAHVANRYGVMLPVSFVRDLADKMWAERDARKSDSELGDGGDDAIDTRIRALAPKLVAPTPRLASIKTPRDIITEIALYFGLTYEDVAGPCRKKYMVQARRVAMYVLHRRSNSAAQIGRWLGNRDHSTILHGLEEYREGATDTMRQVAALYVGAAA